MVASSQPVPRTRHNAVVVVASFSESQRCSAWWRPQGEPEIVGVHPVMSSRSHLMIPELARVVDVEMVSPLT